MNRSRRLCLGTALGLAIAAALAGCETVQSGPPKPKPFRYTPQDFEPRTDVRWMVVGVPGLVVMDTDNDGAPDTVPLLCQLYPSTTTGAIPVIGRGSFRFEVFDAAEPAQSRQPLCEAYEFSFEESEGCVFNSYGLVAYGFRLRLRPLAHATGQLAVRGTFLPEGGDASQAVDGFSPAVPMTNTLAAPPREAIRPWSSSSTRPDVVIIGPRPRPRN
jgi:hypothetical protein